MAKCKVIESQSGAIDCIAHRMKTFVNSHGGVKNNTRIVPLIIPTGWGKTRIAVQSIKQTLGEKKHCTIILYPQAETHISKEVWKRPSDWSDKYDENAEKKEVLGWKPLLSSEIGENKFFYITRSSLENKEYAKKIAGTKGPIFFIIDEWHSKNIVSQYIIDSKENNNKDNNPIDIAKRFWRKTLLLKDCDEDILEKLKLRKLFVLLISATPIASTRHMDDIRFNDYPNELNKVLSAFNELVTVGNRYGGKFYKKYPQLIKYESNKLKKVKKDYQETDKWKSFLSGIKPLEKCAKEYIHRSSVLCEKKKKTSMYNAPIYMEEQALFCGLYPYKVYNDDTKANFKEIKELKQSPIEKYSLKEKTLFSLLKENSDQKFVVFCHHIEIANCLEKKLNKYFRKQKFAYFLRKNEFKAEPFKQFIDPDKSQTKVLIVTDKHSQGVSLHKSNAWLVHYELSWNPVRIIQRFGRVWRIQNGKMTAPVAFYIPYSFSSEEEQLRRLKERWNILTKKNKDTKKKKSKGMLKHIDFAPIEFDVALGIRCTPSPFKDHK